MKTYLCVIFLVIAVRCPAGDLEFTAEIAPLPRLSLLPQTQAQLLALSGSVPTEVVRMAEAEFLRRFGLCGMVRFAGKQGDAWIFSTNIGYGGVPGPTITIVFSPPSPGKQTPNQSPQRNAGIGPAIPDEASAPHRASSSEKTARAQSPRG